MNQLEPMDIEWKYVKHLTLSTCSHVMYRDNRFGLQLEQLTNRDGHGKVGKPKNYYFIDDVEREFTDIEKLCECWNEKRNFDNPNGEILWEKRIVTKPNSQYENTIVRNLNSLQKKPE